MPDRVIRKIEELYADFHDSYLKLKTGGETSPIAGFNMPYSPASTWRADNDTLLLTINPKAQDHRESEGPDARLKAFVPKAVWPDGNEFYAKEFPRQVLFQRAFGQVAKALGESEDKPEKSYAIWSVIPYRTENEKQLLDTFWDDALRKVWGPIFRLWTPANIFVFGKKAYETIRDALAMSATLDRENKENAAGYYLQATGRQIRRSLSFRHAIFRSAEGKKIDLFGLPHPTQHHYYYGGDLSASARFIMAVKG